MSRRKQQAYSPERAPRAEIAIDDLDDTGRGVGRVAGKVVFVSHALPGERVRARYLRTSRRADEAVTEAVLEPSAERVTPFCPVFGRCGGCSLQHWAPSAQRRHREARVHDQLSRAAGAAPGQWLAPVEGPARAYRRCARWRCRWVTGDGLQLGFREQGGHRVVDADACPVLDERLSRLMPDIKRLVAELERPNEVREIEACASDGDTAVGLICDRPPTTRDRSRLSAYQGTTGVIVATRRPDDAAFEPAVPERPPDLWYRLPGEAVTLRFALGDFIQANGAVNQGLVEHALASLALTGGERVLDLFSGVGNFALPAAGRGARVLGLEGEQGLVERARANAEANALAERAAFERADLRSDAVSRRLAQWAPDAVLIDPPRAGAPEVITALQSHPAKRVVYVSCEPATLARDVARLTGQAGYRLSGAGVADMFPHTDHTEAIACLDR